MECIRGHRSSLCRHHARPLLQVRSKGRPNVHANGNANHRIAVFAEEIKPLTLNKTDAIIVVKASEKQVIDIETGKLLGPYIVNDNIRPPAPIITKDSFVVTLGCGCDINKVQKSCGCSNKKKSVNKSKILKTYLSNRLKKDKSLVDKDVKLENIKNLVNLSDCSLGSCLCDGSCNCPGCKVHNIPIKDNDIIKNMSNNITIMTNNGKNDGIGGNCNIMGINRKTDGIGGPNNFQGLGNNDNFNNLLSNNGLAGDYNINGIKINPIVMLNHDLEMKNNDSIENRSNSYNINNYPVNNTKIWACAGPMNLTNYPGMDLSLNIDQKIPSTYSLVNNREDSGDSPSNSCSCPDNGCDCTNCEKHGIINGLKLDELFAMNYDANLLAQLTELPDINLRPNQLIPGLTQLKLQQKTPTNTYDCNSNNHPNSHIDNNINSNQATHQYLQVSHDYLASLIQSYSKENSCCGKKDTLVQSSETKLLNRQSDKDISSGSDNISSRQSCCGSKSMSPEQTCCGSEPKNGSISCSQSSTSQLEKLLLSSIDTPTYNEGQESKSKCCTNKSEFEQCMLAAFKQD
jgi:hypothetical protein